MKRITTFIFLGLMCTLTFTAHVQSGVPLSAQQQVKQSYTMIDKIGEFSNELLAPNSKQVSQSGRLKSSTATSSPVDLGNGLFLLSDADDPSSSLVEAKISAAQWSSLISNSSNCYSELENISKLVYTKFNDDFDFIFFVLDTPQDDNIINTLGFYGVNLGISNSVQGLGLSIYNNASYWGSAGKLKSAMFFPFQDAILMGPALHELCHNWAAFICPTYGLDNSRYDYGGHWGVSNTDGQLGGFKYLRTVQQNCDGVQGKTLYQASIYSNQTNPDGSFTYPGFGTVANGGNGVPYSDIELYLMGMKSAQELRNAGFILDTYSGNSYNNDGDFPGNKGYFYSTTKTTYTIDDIIAMNGARIPDASASQKQFKILTVAISNETASVNYYPQIIQNVGWFAGAMDDNTYQGWLYNFRQATYNVGSLVVNGVKNSLKPVVTNFNVSIGSFSNGSVSTDKTTAAAGETITLTISPYTGYELDVISAYKTGDAATSVALNGSGATRTFTMPGYGVTVTATFKKTADQSAVETAKNAIESASYSVAQTTANTQTDIASWLASQINTLIASTGITVSATNITLTGFTAASAGTASNTSGTNGSFSFTVSLTKGGSSLTTVSKTGTITATSYTPTPTLSVSLSSLNFVASGEQKTFTITSNTNWTLSSNASWASVSPASGSNNGTVTVTVPENTTTTQRTATITISGTGVVTQTINVIQDVVQCVTTVSEFYAQIAAYATAEKDIVVEVCQNLTLDQLVNIPELAGAGKTLTIRSKNPASPVTLTRGANGNVFTVSHATLILENIIIDGAHNGDFEIGGGSLVCVNNGGTLIINDGAILKSNNEAFGGGVFIFCGTAIMNGGEISGNTACGGFTNSGGGISSSCGSGGGVYVCGSYYNGNVFGGTFTMNGGEINGNIASGEINRSTGGGVFITNYGEFTMNGGKINNNTTDYGSGVSVNGGVFTMTNGEISNNIANNPSFDGGGGVCVSNINNLYGGTFTMTGGKINGNTLNSSSSSSGGGGVNVSTICTFTMTGGEISGNTAGRSGGVNVNGDNAVFNMTGGKISGNTATVFGGGVYVQNGTFTLGGAATITDNSVNDITNNVLLENDQYITLDAPTAGMNVGVTKTVNNGVFVQSGATAAYRQYFKADETGKVVTYDNGQLRIIDTPTYGVSIGSFTGGSVSTDKTSAAAGETVTLTILPNAGYELNTISAYKTGDQTTNVTLSGSGVTRTFTMPEYGVTVTATFKKTAEQLAVETAKSTIENASYTVAQTTANTEATVKDWLVSQINTLIASTGITVSATNISLSGFTAAVAGTASNTAGSNGSFSFTVSLTKGSSSLTTVSKLSVITAAAYTPPPTYSVIIGSMVNGSVSVNPATPSVEGTLITLTGSPNAGYELDAVSAYKTGDATTSVVLSGSGVTRTFTMPGYGVTVTATFKKTADQSAVEAANNAIGSASYTVAQTTANTEATVKDWLVSQINTLIASTGITVSATNITLSGFTAAVAGTASNTSGANGNFSFTVSLTKGSSSLTSTSKSGVITAAPYTPPGTYPVTIGSLVNGSVSVNPSIPSTAGTLITLTITPDTGYEFDAVSAYKTGDAATTVDLSGSGATRTFTMPEYGVTITATFKKTAEQQAVETAKNAVESASYSLSQTTANTEATVKDWLVSQINTLIASTGITVSAANITLSNFMAAIDGTADNTAGTNGSFSFTVSLTNGSSVLTTISKSSVITAETYTPPAAYSVVIGSMVNGNVSVSPSAPSAAGTLITLTGTPNAGYELDAVSAYKTGDATTSVTLSGSGSTRTFTMPEYNVTVNATFKKTQAQLDEEAVVAAKAAIEGGTYRIAQATGNTTVDVKTWLVNTLNVLYGQSYNVMFRSTTGTTIIGDVTIASLTPAIAGTETLPEGVNGSFLYTVTLNLDGVVSATDNISGVIVAAPYTETPVKRIELMPLTDLTVRITNTGNAATGKLTLVLSGANANVFTLSPVSIDNLAVGAAMDITLTPIAGLEEKTYTATLTVNGAEMDSQSIDITYNVINTDIGNVTQNKPLTAWIQNGMLHVDGLTAGKTWSVYNVSGKLVYQSNAKSEKADISLFDRGVYLIQSGNKTVKVVF